MKIKIEGIDLEGDPVELAQFAREYQKQESSSVAKGNIQYPPPWPETQPDKEVVVRRRKRSHGRQKETEEKYEKAVDMVKRGMNRGHAINKSFGYCTGEHYKVLNRKLKKLGIVLPQKSGRSKSHVPEEAPKVEDKRITRMKFVASRSKSLMNTYNYSIEKARAIAMEEWAGHGKVVHVHTEENEKVERNAPDDRPMIPVQDDMPIIINDHNKNRLLIDILRHVIGNNGAMTFPNEGVMLGYDTPEKWRILIFSILNNNKIICDYFNAENKFKIDGADNPSRMRIYYER